MDADMSVRGSKSFASADTVLAVAGAAPDNLALGLLVALWLAGPALPCTFLVGTT